jgi:hypothetical protein
MKVLVRAGDDGGWEPNRRGEPSKDEAEPSSEVAGAVVPHGMHYTPHYTQQVKGLALFLENRSFESDAVELLTIPTPANSLLCHIPIFK